MYSLDAIASIITAILTAHNVSFINITAADAFSVAAAIEDPDCGLVKAIKALRPNIKSKDAWLKPCLNAVRTAETYMRNT
jgi:hypothetical protein